MITLPLAGLLVYIVLTYCPLIYRLLPGLGGLKIVLVAGIVMLISFVATHRRYTNPTAYKHKIVYCWAIFLVCMAMGLGVSVDRGLTWEITQANLKYFIVFLVMIKIVDTGQRLHAVLLAFVSSGVVMAGGAIHAYWGNPESISAESVANLTGGIRAIALDGGIFGDPNDLAVLLSSVLPLAIYFRLTSKHKLLSMVGIVILMAGTVVTHSRAGFLGLCVTGLMALVLLRKGQRKFALVFVLLAAIMWSLARESYRQRISTITDWQVDERGMTGTRMDSWRIAIREWLSHPVLGGGAGTSYYMLGGISQDWHTVHNSFVQALVEIGLLGSIAYLMLFVSALKHYSHFSGNIGKSTGSLDLLLKTLAIGFVSFATTAFFTPQAYSPLLYTLTALVVITSEMIRKESNSATASAMQLSEYQLATRELKGTIALS